MIECARTRSLLGRYLDGELAVEEIPPVEGHLRVCQLCAQELGAMRGVSAALRMVAVPPVPEQLAGRVVGRALEQAAAPSSFRDSLRFWAGWSLSMRFAATATAAAACFLGFLIGGSPLPASRPARRRSPVGGFHRSRPDRYSLPGEFAVKLQLKTLGVIFSVVLNIALVTAYAIRKFSDRPRFVYQEVNLSKEQLALIEAGRDRFLGSINEIGDRIIVSHLELIDLIAAEGPDQQAIEGKVQAIRLGQTSMQRIVVDHLLEDRQILTPEQRQRFFAVLKSRIQAQGAPGPPWLPKGARERKN